MFRVFSTKKDCMVSSADFRKSPNQPLRPQKNPQLAEDAQLKVLDRQSFDGMGARI
jgi:hypothetical protein